MAQPDPPSPAFNWRGLILFSIAVALIAGAYLANAKNAGLRDLPYPNFREALDDNQIAHDERHTLDLVRDPQSARAYLQGWMWRSDRSLQKFRTEVNLDFNRDLNQTLLERGIVANPKSDSTFFASAVLSILPVAILVVLAIIFFRQQIRTAGQGAAPPSPPPPGKNIQVIKGAANCVYDVFAASDEDFALLFPPGQDIAFIDEVSSRANPVAVEAALARLEKRRLRKPEVNGIHGTLFYDLDHKKACYPTRRDEEAKNPDGTALR